MIYLNHGGNKMDEMRKRLRTAMDEENITAKELADKTGIPKSSSPVASTFHFKRIYSGKARKTA